VEVDQCPQCSGLFLAKGELETLQASIDTDERKASVDALQISRAPVDAQDTSAIIACPQCRATMDRRRYGFGSQTMIDECPQGCGLWLDGGELGQLETLYESSKDELQIPLTWRIWAAVRGALGKA